MKPSLELYPSLLGLKFAMIELLGELAVDSIAEHPRLVLMAMRGLQAKIDELVEMAKELGIDKSS